MTGKILKKRIMVLRGQLSQTSGGLTANDLNPDGTSKKAREAALNRMNREGKRSFASVFGGKPGAPFVPAPPKGTPKYNKFMKEMTGEKKKKPAKPRNGKKINK